MPDLDELERTAKREEDSDGGVFIPATTVLQLIAVVRAAQEESEAVAQIFERMRIHEVTTSCLPDNKYNGFASRLLAALLPFRKE